MYIVHTFQHFLGHFIQTVKHYAKTHLSMLCDISKDLQYKDVRPKIFIKSNAKKYNCE